MGYSMLIELFEEHSYSASKIQILIGRLFRHVDSPEEKRTQFLKWPHDYHECTESKF